MASRSLRVPDGLGGQRADAGLARLLGFSRTFAAEVIDGGGARQDGALLARADRLVVGAWLEIDWTERAAPAIVPETVDGLSIVYEDDDVVVVDKPPGVAAHPSPGWEGPTVVGALAGLGRRIATSGAAERQGIVHRLDAGTSGLMVVASSEPAYTELKRQFHDREVVKTYHALVQGHPDPLAGTIDAPIGRHPSAGWRFAVTAAGRPAVTHYETIEAFPGASLLEIGLETGRTHQIRVHMAARHHPCCGDALYGADPVLTARLGLDRQWLHAVRLAFRHPVRGDAMVFESPYPADLQGALDIVRGA